MAIAVTCPHCQARMNVRDELAGARGKCPRCAAILQVPAAGVTAVSLAAAPAQVVAAGTAAPSSAGPSLGGTPAIPQTAAGMHSGGVTTAPPQAARPAPATPAGSTPDSLRAVVLGSFTGSITRAPVTLHYRLGALLTAFFMVLLPLIYVGIIALVIWAVYWHATNNVGIVGSVRGKAALMTLVVYLAPLIVGAISIFFMIKPLFAAPANEGRKRSLTPLSDPLLFEFVQRICAIVGAPMPRRIDIDCDINASASFRRGWLSLLTGNDLVLTIGMPLAAGMSLQQFAGVLAHEFGHFAQGTGMRLSYVIRSINFWFMRVVYQRDSWDEWLASSTEGVDLRFAWVLYAARAFVWLTRKILWLLMLAGHAVSGFMMRQMEFDADRYEARLVGSASFESECRQLMLLQIAHQGAQADLSTFYREGRLADNLPALIVANVKQLPEKAREFAAKVIEDSKTGIFDTHPSDKDRIASAHREQAAGVFQSSLPARALFSNFDAACRNVTLDYYQSVLGNRIPPNVIRPVEELLAEQTAELEVHEARNRFFLGSFGMLRPLRMPSAHLSAPEDPKVTKNAIIGNRELMLREAPQYKADYEAYDELDTRLVEATQAACLMSNQLRAKADRFKTAYSTSASAFQDGERCRAEMGKLATRLERFETAAGWRLHGALSLLELPAVASRIAGSDKLRQECHRLLPLAGIISNHLETILKMRQLHARIAVLIEHLQDGKQTETAVRDLLKLTAELAAETRGLHELFSRFEYPFQHADGAISVGRYLLRICPPADEIGEVYHGAEQLLDNLLTLYGRSVSRLCGIAEQIEKRLGLPPLESPASEAAAATS